jgi:hypothetical protein
MVGFRVGCIGLLALLCGAALQAQEPAPATPGPGAPVETRGEVCFDGCPPPSSRVYGSVEYILWWMRGVNLPPLATQGNILDPGIAGALGQPNTLVVIGDTNSQTGANSGGRFTLGGWLDSERLVGLEGDFFFLAQRRSSAGAASDGNLNGTAVLARPFIQEGLLLPNAQQIALPGQSGFIALEQQTRLFGAEANLRAVAWEEPGFRLDLLAGFRFLALDDSLIVGSAFTDLTGFAAISSAASFDSFSVRNRFYGGQLGATAEFHQGNWLVAGTAKFALGGTAQSVTINGGTLTTAAGATTASATGLLAQPTNINHYDRGAFAFVPELGIAAGYRLTERLSAYAGYTLLYDTNVVRAANQINLVANTPTLAGPLPAGQMQPAFQFHSTDFWAQGLTFGLAYRY